MDLLIHHSVLTDKVIKLHWYTITWLKYRFGHEHLIKNPLGYFSFNAYNNTTSQRTYRAEFSYKLSQDYIDYTRVGLFKRTHIILGYITNITGVFLPRVLKMEVAKQQSYGFQGNGTYYCSSSARLLDSNPTYAVILIFHILKTLHWREIYEVNN